MILALVMNNQKLTDNVKLMHEIILLSQPLPQRMVVWLETIKILLMIAITGNGNVMVRMEELQLNVPLLNNLLQ
jgi:hypothetical protein